jgi:hypothetical protein
VFERYNVVSEADLKLAAARLSEHLRAKNAALEGERHTIGTQASEGANGAASPSPAAPALTAPA